jgi:hypothetical protein
MQDDLPGDAGVDLGHFAGFAFQVAEDQRAEAGLAGISRRRPPAIAGAGDQLEVAAGQAGSPGLTVSDSGLLSQSMTAGASML